MRDELLQAVCLERVGNDALRLDITPRYIFSSHILMCNRSLHMRGHQPRFTASSSLQWNFSRGSLEFSWEVLSGSDQDWH